MTNIIFIVVFFFLGYILARHSYNEQHKKYMLSTSKLLEVNFYFVLKEYMEMHNYGIQALKIILEKCSEDNPEMVDEYKKIYGAYEYKLELIGNRYFATMQNIFPYDLKIKTYKEAKEYFDSLINKK